MSGSDREPLHALYCRLFRERFREEFCLNSRLKKQKLIAPAALLVVFLGAVSTKALLNDPEKAENFLTDTMGLSSVVVEDNLFLTSNPCFLGNDFKAVTSAGQNVSGTFCWYGFFEEKTEVRFDHK